MLEVPEKYRTMAKSDAREVSVKVVIGSVELTNDDIIELNIYRSLGENGFGIGGTVTTRVRLLCIMTLPYTGTVSLEVYVRFGFDDKTSSDYVQLGRFYGQVTNPIKKNNQIEIIGYDKLGSSGLSARCTFATWGDASLTFPCTAQEMLEYFCARKNIETEIICNDYDIPEMPVKDKTKDIADYERYYTYGEIISFIAAAHGANAAIDNSGKLVFLSAKQSEEQVNASDCIDFSLTTAEQFTVKGILLHVQDTLSTGSTNIFINDDSKKAYDGEIYEGVAEASCCFGSIEIAEALWGQLGGFAYTSCEFTRRGCGWTELGDVISATDDMRVNVYGKNVSRDIMVQTVEWGFSAANGFTEHIISKADNSEESAERLGSNNTINYSGGGVGEFTDDAKTSEIFNSYKDVTDETTGQIAQNKNYINPDTTYAHVSGSSNSIDKKIGEGEATSKQASILGGAENTLLSSPAAVITAGANNSILMGSKLSIIGAGNGNTLSKSQLSMIGAGAYNAITDSDASIIGAGNGNKLSKSSNSVIGAGVANILRDGASLSGIFTGNNNIVEDVSCSGSFAGSANRISKSTNCAILAGSGNCIEKVANEGFGRPSNNAILTGYKNKILSDDYYSAIVCGAENSMTQAMRSCILSGNFNTIYGAYDSIILGGHESKIIGSYCYSDAVCGYDIIADGCNYTAVFGQSIRATNVNDCLIAGKGHFVEDMDNVLFCGQFGTSKDFNRNALVFVVGGGTSIGNPKNVAYIDIQGTVYARSFNIIGAEAATIASAEAAQPSDISELARQVGQMQSEIEALKSEIEQLKGAAS